MILCKLNFTINLESILNKIQNLINQMRISKLFQYDNSQYFKIKLNIQ